MTVIAAQPKLVARIAMRWKRNTQARPLTVCLLPGYRSAFMRFNLSPSVADEKGVERALRRHGLRLSKPTGEPCRDKPRRRDPRSMRSEEGREGEAWQYVLDKIFTTRLLVCGHLIWLTRISLWIGIRTDATITQGMAGECR
jgi:hypothetical protein